MRLYIDPGTGSMLFAIVIALVGLLFYLIRGLIIKIRFMISAGKQSGYDASIIPLVIFGEDKVSETPAILTVKDSMWYI